MARGIKIAIVAILWLVPASILGLTQHSGWEKVWFALAVPAEPPPFVDLRGITGANVTMQSRGDPLVANPGDPHNRRMNYPRIWPAIFSILGIDNGNVFLVGLAFCGFYLTCISVLILRCERTIDACILLAAGLSLAPLIAIELGNTDLLIFTLVFLGCFAPANALRSGALAVASVLKIYPLAALAMDAVRRPLRQKAVPALLMVLVLGSFAWQWHDLQSIRDATPVSNGMAFGTLSMKAQVKEEWGALPGRAAAGWALVGTCWLAAGAAAMATWKNRPPLDESLRRSTEGVLFSTFGAIYIFAFAVGSNWDYRLIFLLPTLPLAFELVRTAAHRWWGALYIAAILVAENPFDLRSSRGPVVSHLTTFLLFVLVLTMLAQMCKLLRARSEPEAEAGAARPADQSATTQLA